MGYLNNEEASEQLWAGGYHAYRRRRQSIDAEGYVTSRDRFKDVVKSGGEWISSLALENIILEKRGVRRVAVIGVPDDKWGERPFALVILDENSSARSPKTTSVCTSPRYVERGLISRIAIPDRSSSRKNYR